MPKTVLEQSAEKRKKQEEANKKAAKRLSEIQKARAEWKANKPERTKRVEAAQDKNAWMKQYEGKKVDYKDGGVAKMDARKAALRRLRKRRG